MNDEFEMIEHAESGNQIGYRQYTIDKLSDTSFMTIDWL